MRRPSLVVMSCRAKRGSFDIGRLEVFAFAERLGSLALVEAILVAKKPRERI